MLNDECCSTNEDTKGCDSALAKLNANLPDAIPAGINLEQHERCTESDGGDSGQANQ